MKLTVAPFVSFVFGSSHSMEILLGYFLLKMNLVYDSVWICSIKWAYLHKEVFED